MEAAHCTVVWNCSVQLNDIFMFKAVNGVFSVRLRRSGSQMFCCTCMQSGFGCL